MTANTSEKEIETSLPICDRQYVTTQTARKRDNGSHKAPCLPLFSEHQHPRAGPDVIIVGLSPKLRPRRTFGVPRVQHIV